jgi:hypothetical protein
MKALLLDATEAGDERTARAADALAGALAAVGYAVDRAVIRDLDVRACTGCFGCWTRTPGECVIADDARGLAERAIGSDLVAVVSPISYGSYGSLAKSVLDRMICLVLPHFTMVRGEVHHRPRYAAYPVWIALGTLAAPAPEEAALFARLVERNAVNLHNPGHAASVVVGDDDPAHAAELLLAAAGVRTEVPA